MHRPSPAHGHLRLVIHHTHRLAPTVFVGYSLSAEICRALKMKCVAPMPEQINTPTLGIRKTLLKCSIMVPICSGMGATNLKFWVLSR